MDIQFSLEGMIFEYDEDKNRQNIIKHGISFEIAARVFLDYDRIEMYDDEHSMGENRYDTIGDISVSQRDYLLGSIGRRDDILFVVYAEREEREDMIITRLISARKANSFERGLYYGKY